VSRSAIDYAAELRQDVSYALRVLRRTPAFTAVAIATLGLGIGASTTIFTVIDGVLLRPLRFVEPSRLAAIRPSSGSRVSPAYLYEWRLQSRTLHDLAGWQDIRTNLTGEGDPIEVMADRATTNFFALLGTPALVGRTFATERDLRRVAPEAVLSYGFWQRRYGGDPGVIGRAITLDGETVSIVGVMPAGFTIRTNELAESRAELWLPLSLAPRAPTDTGMGGFLNVVGRLATGATIEEAQAEISIIARRLEENRPSYSHNWTANVVPLHEATVRDVRLSLLVLFGATGILLLIACANVANLFLSRASARQKELTVRLSLGATAARLLRQFLTESFVLAAVGGALGVVLAVWGTSLLISTLPVGLDIPRTREIGVDLRVLAAGFFLTVLTGLLFGLLPSMSATRWASPSLLRVSTGGASGGGRSRNRLGNLLIVSEIALALILLAVAGLLGRSVWALGRSDPGFQPTQVLTLRLTLPASKYDNDDRVRMFGQQLLQRIDQLPGVRAAGSANYLPLSNIGIGGVFEIAGRAKPPAGSQSSSWMSVVGGRYFEAMGIPLLRGRLPGAVDTERTRPVFVIDEELAQRYWPGADPIGARLTWRRGEKSFSGEIIGVVGHVRWASMAAGSQPTTYFWFPQDPDREIAIAARVVGDPIAVADMIAGQVRAIDPNQPVAEVRAMQEFVSADLARPRFTMRLVGSFAAAALLLTAIGVYGVIAFGVAQRTREIGVRVALGAQRRDVIRLVMRRGLLLIGTGLAVGIPATLATGRAAAGLLFGVRPDDLPTLLAAAVFLTAVGMLATYLPARRATRVDPMVALRTD
jgi:predicted permease